MSTVNLKITIQIILDFYHSEETDSHYNYGGISHNNHKIFHVDIDVEKFRNRKIKNFNNEQIAKSQPSEMTISERMRIKKEKTKFLLGEKKQRESETEDGSICNSLICNQTFLSSSNKDFIIEDDKIFPLVEKMDNITKKEIKILRNRISAQKSRDRKKQELDELKILSNKLFSENNLLQNKLTETERELKFLKEKIKLCKSCGNNQVDNYNTNSREKINHINTIISTNSMRNQNINTNISISDMSQASRSNFSNRSKLGIFTGLFLVVFFIGCLLLSPINENKLRVLQSLPEPNLQLSSQNNQTAIIEFKNDFKNIYNINPKNLPVKKNDNHVAVQTNYSTYQDENLLGRKRIEFMINMSNKLRVAQSIDKINKVPRNYNFRNENFNSYKENDYCLNNNDVTCQIKDESNKLNKFIVPKNYFENHIEINIDSANNEEEISPINKFSENVESLLCKDYVTTSNNKNHNFEEIIRKKLKEKDVKDLQSSKNSDCMYLHMLIPAKENSLSKNKTNIIDDLEHIDNHNTKTKTKINTYFEIGCKIFEINKIYK